MPVHWLEIESPSAEPTTPEESSAAAKAGGACGGLCCAFLIWTIIFFLLPYSWETGGTYEPTALGDLLFKKARECADAHGQTVAIVLADGNGKAIREDPASTNLDLARGKVRHLVASSFDTETLCDSSACQWGSLLRWVFTKRFRAQGSVVIDDKERNVLAVLAVAGNPSQLDDEKCAKQGAVEAGFVLKPGGKPLYYLPPVDTVNSTEEMIE